MSCQIFTSILFPSLKNIQEDLPKSRKVMLKNLLRGKKMQTPKKKTFYDWYFISIYKINRTLHYFTHSWEILSAREDKIRIPKRPCTMLYIFTPLDDWAIIRVGTLSSSAWYWCCTRVLSLITFHSNSQHTAVKQHIHRKWAEFLKIKATIFFFKFLFFTLCISVDRVFGDSINLAIAYPYNAYCFAPWENGGSY